MTTTELRPCWFYEVSLSEPGPYPHAYNDCHVKGKLAGIIDHRDFCPPADLKPGQKWKPKPHRDPEFEFLFNLELNRRHSIRDIAIAVRDLMSSNLTLESDGESIILNGKRIITLVHQDDATGIYYSTAEDALFEVDL